MTVCVWGEFGRTPKINKDAGRDHWSRVNSALLAGGGMRTGQVIGITDSAAGEAKDEPVPYRERAGDGVQEPRHRPARDGLRRVATGPTPILPGGVRRSTRLY